MNDETLDPPGSIAVIGAGPLGCEAALYGRFLGYDVTLIESRAVGNSIRRKSDQPLAMMPDRCLSPLALQALETQRVSSDAEKMRLPTTYGQWVSQALEPLTETDLLRGRLRCPSRVLQIDQVPLTELREGESSNKENAESNSQPSELIPPDFRLTWQNLQGDQDCIDFESVILAVGDSSEIRLGFDLPAPYFFRIGFNRSGDDATDLAAGHKQIVAVYASLAGRAELDLYRPRRM